MTEQLTQQQRDDYIDESRRVALETLQIPEVQRRLGGYAQELFALTNSTVSTPVKNGILAVQTVTTNKLPVTVLRSEENFDRMVTTEPFDDYQRQSILDQYGEMHLNKVTRLFRQRYRDQIVEPLDVSDYAGAAIHTINPKDLQGNMIKGRPLALFMADKSLLPHIAPPIWNHELIHAIQARRLPIWNKSLIDFHAHNLSEELEAYAVGAMTILGIQDADRQSKLLASLSTESIDRLLEVDDIRAQANRYETDPYAASAKVADELVAAKHGITPFLRKRVEESS